MSKERARRRAERELLAARNAAAHRTARERAAARRVRHRRRQLAWRRARLWRRGATAQHTRERRVLIGGVLLSVVVASYLITGSIAVVIGVTLVAAIATPALVTAFLERSSR